MFLSVQDLVGLPGMPTTPQGVRKMMKKVSETVDGITKKKPGSKAIEYHIDCLPKETADAIRERHFKSVLHSEKTAFKQPLKGLNANKVKPKDELAIMRQCPTLLDNRLGGLTQAQRDVADARMQLVNEVLALEENGLPRIRAVEFVSEQSKKGLLPERLQQLVSVANARQRKNSNSVCSRTLKAWVLDYLRATDAAERLALLAPKKIQPVKPENIKWLPHFLAHWRNPNGPTMNGAYRAFSEEWDVMYADQPVMLAIKPSFETVRKAMKKLPKIARAAGRATGSAAKALQVYVKRDWSAMPVNGVWISDGKSMDMKVAHPVHGKPFTPELTLVLDGRTRVLVGWSASLSENCIAVSDAYRHAISRFGIPLIAYSDNGGGEKNKMLDAPVTGIFSRLGVHHATGIPGNPQGRGIIERLNAVIPYNIAQRFQTYNGRGADAETVRKTMVGINSAVNARKNNKALTTKQQNALAQLPSWQQMIDAIEEEIEKYNNSHQHSELPKVNGKHMTPMQYYQYVMANEKPDIDLVSELELRDMFMPQDIRVASRGWVSHWNNEYFHQDLINVDGEEVIVHFDIHDASKVIIRKMTGEYICTAIHNGNKRAAFPVAVVEAIQQKRTRGRLKRVEDKKQEILEEARPVINGESLATDDWGLIGDIVPQKDKEEELYLFAADKEKSQNKKVSGY